MPVDLDRAVTDMLSGGPTPKSGPEPAHVPLDLDKAASDMLTAPAHVEHGQLELDPSEDWDSFRQAFDEAIDGHFSSAKEDRAKAKAAWEKANPSAAAIATAAGKIAPEVAIAAGVGLVAPPVGEAVAGDVGADIARFLTGTSQGNRLLTAASQGAAGLWQGALAGKLQGQPVGSSSLVGGLAGASTPFNPLIAPLRSNITPATRALVQAWRDQGLPVSLSQIPGAPLATRVTSKLLNLGKSDVPQLTSALMKSAGSSSPKLTPQTVSDARQDIKSRMDTLFNTSTWSNSDDSKVPQMFSDTLANSHLISPQEEQQVRLAQNQWINSLRLDRMARDSDPTTGLVDPSVVLGHVMTTTKGLQYPMSMTASQAAAYSGNPVDLQTLGEGAQSLVRQPVSPMGHGMGVLGTILGGGEIAGHVMPYLESMYGPYVHAAGIGAGLTGAYGAVGQLMNNPLYMRMLLGGVRTGANPLVPTATYLWGDKVENPLVSSAGASELSPGASDYAPRVNAVAGRYGLDPDVMMRQIDQESGFKNLAPNRAGARGIAQFVPETAERYGIDPMDPTQALEGMGHYMSDLRSRYGGNTGLALAGYNMGENGLDAALAGKRNIPKETRDYVQSITGRPLDDWITAYRNPAGVQVSAGPTSSGLTSVLQPTASAAPANELIGGAP